MLVVIAIELGFILFAISATNSWLIEVKWEIESLKPYLAL